MFVVQGRLAGNAGTGTATFLFLFLRRPPPAVSAREREGSRAPDPSRAQSLARLEDAVAMVGRQRSRRYARSSPAAQARMEMGGAEFGSELRICAQLHDILSRRDPRCSTPGERAKRGSGSITPPMSRTRRLQERPGPTLPTVHRCLLFPPGARSPAPKKPLLDCPTRPRIASQRASR